MTRKIREERVDGLTFKIDEERADGWSAKTGEERADGWTYRKVVEQMLVDGDGSESGECNLAQVNLSTEITRECKWKMDEESTALVAPRMASVESMASMVASKASMVASKASMVASMASNGWPRWRRWWLRWRRWLRWVTGVFDTEGTDVEAPLCPQ